MTDSIPVGVDIDTVETQPLQVDTTGQDSSVGGPKDLKSTEPPKKSLPPVPEFDETPEPPVPQLLITHFPYASTFLIFNDNL